MLFPFKEQQPCRQGTTSKIPIGIRILKKAFEIFRYRTGKGRVQDFLYPHQCIDNHQREQHYEDALKVLSGMLVDRGGENAYTDSDLALVYIARAGVELDMRHDDLALVDLNEAIRLDTGQAEAYMMRGQVYLMQDKKTQAKRDFEKAVSLGVPQSEARKWLMRCK